MPIAFLLFFKKVMLLYRTYNDVPAQKDFFLGDQRTMDLKMSSVEIENGVEFNLCGELQFMDYQPFVQKILSHTEDKGPNICLNLNDLKFIDSAGLGGILYLSEALRMRGQKMEIKNANPKVLKLLNVIHAVGNFYIV
jgi:anti-anti-sigma factor